MPPYGPARAARFELRLSPEELATYQTAAMADGRSVTAWILRVLAERIERDLCVSEKSTGRGKKSRRGS